MVVMWWGCDGGCAILVLRNTITIQYKQTYNTTQHNTIQNNILLCYSYFIVLALPFYCYLIVSLFLLYCFSIDASSLLHCYFTVPLLAFSCYAIAILSLFYLYYIAPLLVLQCSATEV